MFSAELRIFEDVPLFETILPFAVTLWLWLPYAR